MLESSVTAGCCICGSITTSRKRDSFNMLGHQAENARINGQSPQIRCASDDCNAELQSHLS